MTKLPVLKGKTRPYKAGRQMASAICETANILYLLDNRRQYIEGIKDGIDHELEKVVWIEGRRKIINEG